MPGRKGTLADGPGGVAKDQVAADPAIEPLDAPGLRGVLHHPAGAPGPAGPAADGLVLAHGAGSTCRTPLLEALARAFAARGLLALRCDLPFRQRRATGPPGPGDPARDREGLRRALDELGRRGTARRLLGGHSYGGRQASLLAAGAPDLAAGLLLLAYPLHPPRHPTEDRTEHFPRLRMPVLFVHGTCDPFATPGQLRRAAARIPAPTACLEVAGAGHDLAGRRPAPDALGALAARVAEAFLALLA